MPKERYEYNVLVRLERLRLNVEAVQESFRQCQLPEDLRIHYNYKFDIVKNIFNEMELLYEQHRKLEKYRATLTKK